MTGFFYILAAYLAGTALSRLTGGAVPGSVIGMVLLFAALSLRWVDADKVRTPARFILGIMALFFVPVGVGLVDAYGSVEGNLMAVGVATVVSTLLVLVVVGRMQQWWDGRAGRKGGER